MFLRPHHHPETDLMSVADTLREAGLTIKDAEFIYKGKAPVPVSEADEVS